jgi:putative Mg2+ transporter-C (MgtC) family protein
MQGTLNLVGTYLFGSWEAEAVLRLAVAAALGGFIGAEREHRGASAGFRTQILVSVGAALAMLVSLYFGETYGTAADTNIRIDPARVAYGVMGGVGFLGAGAILRYGAGVRGLTTAAGLWCTAAVGLACGFGMFLVAAVATGIVVFALMVLARLDEMIPSRIRKTVVVSCRAGEDVVGQVRKLLTEKHIRVEDVDIQRDLAAGTEEDTFRIRLPSKVQLSELSGLIQSVPGISHFAVR